MAQSLVNQRGPKKARDMTPLKALGLEVPSGRLLRIHGDLLRQQPPVQWQHGRRIAPAAQGAAAAPAPDQPDQADQPMVNRLEDHGAGPPEVEPIDDGAENDQLPLLDDGQGCQSPTKKHGEAMKDSEPSGDSGPSEEKANKWAMSWLKMGEVGGKIGQQDLDVVVQTTFQLRFWIETTDEWY